MEKLISKYEKEKKARLEINLKHASQGVEFVDIYNAYIDETVAIGSGTVIGSNVILEGETQIGSGCKIEHNSRITDSVVGDNTRVEQSIIISSHIGNNTTVGPFAYMRPGNKVGNNVKIGDFVEVKNSTIAHGSKASHLTYIGDADVGENVNLGCGVVFVNYDGKNKFRSKIGDNSFIGCNVNIVAPVVVEEDSYVAAGTTLTKNVKSGSLAIGRVKERNIEGWVKKRGLLKSKK